MLYTLSDMDMREDAVACPAMDRQAWLSCREYRRHFGDTKYEIQGTDIHRMRVPPKQACVLGVGARAAVPAHREVIGPRVFITAPCRHCFWTEYSVDLK
jgi:hypothetical protein